MNLRSRCHSSTGSDNDTFIGIKYINKELVITFPIGYRIPDDEKTLKKAIISLIKSISLTESINKKIEFINDTFKNEYYMPILSYFNLIDDYIKNGLYVAKEKIYSQNNGNKINWKRTIQNSDAIIADDNLIYMNPYYERTKNKDNIITEIEKYCLRVSLDMLSWYFGNVRIPKSQFKEKDTDYMLKMLKKELSISFTDYKKKLIVYMIDILTGLDERRFNNKAFTFGTSNYHIVWEKMIADLFGTENLEDYYPSANWHLLNGDNGKASSLRPDCIHYDKDNKKYYVIDAKYYHFCEEPVISKLPGSDSIQKQITYAAYINVNKNIDGNMIYNAFILPFNKEDERIININNESVLYYGYSDCNWTFTKGNENYPYNKISLIFYDTRELIENWFERNSTNIISIKKAAQLVNKQINK